MSLLIVLPGITASIFASSAVYLSFKSYLRKRFVELSIICLGFVCYTLHPILFAVFYFIQGDKYTQLRTVFAVFQLIIASLGFIIMWLSMQNLSSKDFSFRKYCLIGISLFGIGFSANGFGAKWDDEGKYWELHYQPSWGVIFLALPLIWVSVEILILSKEVLESSQDTEQKIPERLIYYGWILIIFTLIFLMVERSLYQNSIIYLVPATFALLLMAVAIYIDPYSIIPKTIGGEYLLISDRDSGLPLFTHNFGSSDQERDTPQTFLFSGAMKGIVTLMNEVIGKPDLPQNFGYANYDIMIEKSENYIAYFICLKSVTAVRVVLSRILEVIENGNFDVTMVSNDQKQELLEMVTDELKFATIGQAN
ncbi:MAG: hypothetical protein ACXAD7_06420 [Candidatus Kariarchaeaceae archaeon]